MTTKALWLLTGNIVVFLFYAEGSINPFGFWNAFPIILGAAWILSSRSSKSPKIIGGAIGFFVFSTTLILYLHLSWFFDWGGSQTDSSTSGLIFVLAPIYAFVLGALGYALGRIAGEERAKSKGKST